jgi:hypothetical protein
VVPGYNGRNKSFFFFDYEKSSETDGATGTYSVPQTAWAQGDFTGLFGSTKPVLYDPYTVAATGTDASGNAIYTRQPLVGDDGSYNKLPNKYLISAASKVAQNVLGYFPTPTSSNEYNNYSTAGSSPNDYWHYDARLDKDVTQKWHSFLRWSQQYGSSAPLNDYASVKGGVGSPSNWNGPMNTSALSISFNNTVTFSPTLLGEFRFGFSKSTQNRDAYSSGFDLTSLGLPASYSQEAAKNALVFPSFNFNGGFSPVGTDGWVVYQEDPTAQDYSASIVKIHNAHSLKAGGEYRDLRLNFFQYGDPAGYYSTDESWTRLNPQDSSDGTGFSFASFMMGLSNGGGSSYITNSPKAISTSGYLAFYAQDDWKVSRKLTLNVGVRYDWEIPRVENSNQQSYFDPYSSSPLGSVTAADGVTCTACGSLRGQMVLVNSAAARWGRRQGPTQYNDFAPRFGFSYNPNSKLVLRGGAGLVFQPSAMQAAGTSGGSGMEGFSTQTNFATTFDNEQSAPVADLSNPFPSYNSPQAKQAGCLASASCVQGIDIGNGISESYFDSYRTPYSIQWNFNAQYAVRSDIKVEVGYMANRGLFLVDGDPGHSYDQLPTSYLSQGAALLNQVSNPFSGKICTNADTTGSCVVHLDGSGLSQSTVSANQLLRKYPQYGGINSFRKPGSDSMYNAFTLRVDKQYSHGLTFTLSFTDGREYDNAASPVSYLGNSSQTFADQYNPKAEWGIGAQNVSYDVAASFLYELPFGHGKAFLNSAGRGTNLLVNGWQFSGIENWTTGTPIVLGSVDNGTTKEAIFTQNQRPAWNGTTAKISAPSYRQWFNPMVFSTPAAYTIGNAPRALADVNNPSSQNIDLSLTKNTKFGPSDRGNVQFRLEAFNAFNHGALSGPDTGVRDGNFGTISSFANNARRLQIAAKVNF